MEKLFEVLDNLIRELSEAKNTITKMIADYHKVFKVVTIREAELKKLGEDLDKREEAIGDSERIIELDKKNKITLKKIAEEKDALVQAQHDFDNYVIAKKKEISQAITKNETEANNNKKDAEDNKKLKEQLLKEKAGYKQKIAQGIVDSADK